MTRPGVINCLILSAAAILLSAPSAQAASLQTFVSVFGSNDNTSVDCRRLNPCRAISSALSVTSPGGVLTVLDSGRYGPFTVTRSMQVVAAPGVQAIVIPTAGANAHAALVDAPDAQVTLRGLYFFAETNVGASGINVRAVGTLHIEDCVMSGFGVGGVNVDFAPVGTTPTKVFISDTVVRDCRSTGRGIFIQSNGRAGFDRITAVIERVRVENCSSGVVIHNNVDAVVRDSVSSGNNIMGIIAVGLGEGRRAEMVVDNCLVTGNGYGIASTSLSGGESSIDVVGTTITFNLSALRISGLSTQIRSGGGNTVLRNTENTEFSPPARPSSRGSR